MKFKSWADGERGRAAALAMHLGVSQAFMSEMVGGVKAIPIKHCQSIYAFTGGDVSLQEMRPNDWQKYWPELAFAPASQAQAATETVATTACADALDLEHSDQERRDCGRREAERRDGQRRGEEVVGGV